MEVDDRLDRYKAMDIGEEPKDANFFGQGQESVPEIFRSLHSGPDLTNSNDELLNLSDVSLDHTILNAIQLWAIVLVDSNKDRVFKTTIFSENIIFAMFDTCQTHKYGQ